MENKQTEPSKYPPVFFNDDHDMSIIDVRLAIQNGSEYMQILSDRTKEIVLNIGSPTRALSRWVTDDKGLVFGDIGIMERESRAMKAAIQKDRPVDAMSYRRFHVAYERFMGCDEAKQLDRPLSLNGLYANGRKPNESIPANGKAHPSKMLMIMMLRMDGATRYVKDYMGAFPQGVLERSNSTNKETTDRPD